jgi:mono/diheme cytochrome c family protein
MLKNRGIVMNSKTLWSILLLTLILPATAQSSDVSKGQSIYQQRCAMCHGTTGKGSMAGAPDFKRREGLFQSDQSLLARIKAGKNACPAYQGILTDQKIYDVIAYLRTLSF